MFEAINHGFDNWIDTIFEWIKGNIDREGCWMCRGNNKGKRVRHEEEQKNRT